VIDNVALTNSWPSIAGAGCSLIFVGAGEERALKFLPLRGLRGVDRQVGSARLDLVAERDQERATWWQEKQDEVVDMRRCRVVLTTRVCTWGLRWC
jgi:hypothetical protein